MKDKLTPKRGLTERRLFAAMAMQGVLSSLSTSFSPHAQPYEEINAIAKDAVKLADALIEELDKPVSAEQPPGETL